MLLEQVSSGEIEGIQCRQPGCETEWVCELFAIPIKSLDLLGRTVSSCVYCA
jgi:hypothetical protein